MKIFLTGASGMVGQNILVNHKLQRHEWLKPTHRELDLTNGIDVQNYIGDHRPDMVIHCAGLVGGIQANMEHPVDFLVQNMDMGRNVVMGSYKNNVSKLITFASNCMYPRDVEGALSESMILKGELEPTNEGYALAKIVTSRLCKYISKGNPKFTYRTIVPCSLYGKWDKFAPKHSHLIPAIIKKLIDAKNDGLEKVEIWGDGTAKREFMYAGDVAEFLNFAIEQLDKIPDVINIGSGEDKTINEYYKMIAEIVNFQGEFYHNLERPVGMKRKLLDVSLQRSIKWNPPTSLHDGLKETCRFYLDNIDKYKE